MKRSLIACWLAMVGGALLATGCAQFPRAQNPLPGVFRIAVIDFSDKSNGAVGLDTKKITEIFASELQKIPTYEVVPVEEVREVLGPVKIDTNQPQLAFEVARALHAQAVIIGAVTEFNAHYPPRLGLHCEMYAMVTGQPEAVVQSPAPVVADDREPLAEVIESVRGAIGERDPAEREERRRERREKHPHHHCLHCGKNVADDCTECPNCKHSLHSHGKLGWFKRGRFADTENATGEEGKTSKPEETPESPEGPTENLDMDEVKVPLENASAEEMITEYGPAAMPRHGVRAPKRRPTWSDGEDLTLDAAGLPIQRTSATGTPEELARDEIPEYQVSVKPAIDPIPIVEPWVIRHSRIFDSTNVGLTRKLRDYYFFHDDLRGGDWQGYVHRNEDFNRFACNLMIYEMLEAAGGDWITLRGVRIPQPWLPWPPR